MKGRLQKCTALQYQMVLHNSSRYYLNSSTAAAGRVKVKMYTWVHVMQATCLGSNARAAPCYQRVTKAESSRVRERYNEGVGRACIVRMSKRPRKTLTEMMSPAMVRYMSAEVPVNQWNMGRKSGCSSEGSSPPAATSAASTLRQAYHGAHVSTC